MIVVRLLTTHAYSVTSSLSGVNSQMSVAQANPRTYDRRCLTAHEALVPLCTSSEKYKIPYRAKQVTKPSATTRARHWAWCTPLLTILTDSRRTCGRCKTHFPADWRCQCKRERKLPSSTEKLHCGDEAGLTDSTASHHRALSQTTETSVEGVGRIVIFL